MKAYKYYIPTLVLLFLMSIKLFAQDGTTTIPIKEGIVPQAIKSALNIEFPNYKVTQYAGVPRDSASDEFIEESDGGIDDEFEAITVNLEGIKNDLLATYDFEGNLKTVFSSKSNTDIPDNVTLKMNKSYPEWTIINYYRHLFGDTITDYVVIKKGNDIITLFTDEFGDFKKL